MGPTRLRLTSFAALATCFGCGEDKGAAREGAAGSVGTGESEQQAPCVDADVDARRAWLTSPTPSGDGSAKDNGFRIEGKCADRLRSRALDCGAEAVAGVFGGPSGWLVDANKLGFTTFVCEAIGDGTTTRYPIAELVVDAKTLPAMVLPKTHVKAGDVLGKRISQVPKRYGKPSVSANEYDYEIAGGKLRLVVADKRVVRMSMFVDGFIEGRDDAQLLEWLGVDGSRVAGRSVTTRAFGGGVAVELGGAQ